MRQPAEQAGHDLRAGVAFGIAIALAVHDEGKAVGFRNADAAFNAIGLPEDITAQRMQEVAHLIGCFTVLLHPIELAMTPGRCRAGRED